MRDTARGLPNLLLACSLSLTPCSAQPSQVRFGHAAGSPLAVGRQPVDVAAGDVDGNGTLDLLTVNAGDDNVSILLGDGRGAFRAAPGSPVAAGPSPHLLALGDLTGDGKPDVAITTHDSNDVVVLLNAGAAAFKPAPGSPFTLFRDIKPHNHGLALGDLNGDGHLDITAGHQDMGSVAVLLGDGKGGFTTAPTSPMKVGRAIYPHVLVDVNEDGQLDLAAPDLSGSVAVWLGDGRGGFAPAPGSPISVANRPYFLHGADLDGDGDADIAVAHDDITLISVLLGDGAGRFAHAAGSPFDAGRRGGRLASADLDGDGRQDLAIADGEGVRLFAGDGRGRFSAMAGSPYRTGRETWRVITADVNGDGKPEVLCAGQRDGRLTVLTRR